MANITATKYTYRFLARFVIEAKTPLAVGSGEKDIITDALVAKDVNGLPYIPATSIAGVVRNMIGKEITKDYFGYQEREKGKGSEIIFTEAKILNSKGEVIDGLELNAFSDPLLEHYKELPIRQHVRITHKGVTDKAGKFDEQVVFAGTRFCFELEMVSDGKNYSNFEEVLKQLKSNTFRIGSGTRCGFGEIDVVDLQTMSLNLKKEDELYKYLDKPSSLNSDFWNKELTKQEKIAGCWTEYKLTLCPEDFFLFSSGFGDDDVDMTPVKEKKVIWKDGKGEMSKEMVLIPATSIKGALSHRVAFYYNKLRERYADIPNTNPKVGKNNEAVSALFGSDGERISDKYQGQTRGKVIFSDIFKAGLNDKILNHVAIDRFTGGAIEGALFNEKTTYGKGENLTMSIFVDYSAIDDKDIRKAFEGAIGDICNGLLPLGGGVNRGNGIFTGSYTITEHNNGENK